MLISGLLAENAILIDDAPRAAPLHELLSPFVGRNVTATFDLSIGSVSRLLGGLTAVTGALDHAVRHFEGALADHERWGAATCGARTRTNTRRSYGHGHARAMPTAPKCCARRRSRAASDLGMDRARDQILVAVTA